MEYKKTKKLAESVQSDLENICDSLLRLGNKERKDLTELLSGLSEILNDAASLADVRRCAGCEVYKHKSELDFDNLCVWCGDDADDCERARHDAWVSR